MTALRKLGKFITIEGQDGAGKSSNIDALVKELARQNIPYVQTREPGGTELGEALRAVLLDKDQPPIDDKAELLMIFAARAQHLHEVIEPALIRGDWVVCDRFTDATYAYQGGGRELGQEIVADLESLVQGELRPDLTVLLDLPSELGEQRVGQRAQPDRFEQENLAFKQRVRQVYLDRSELHHQVIKRVDASKPLEQVQQQVTEIVKQFIEGVSG
ncbi:MAG: dTMP kinase [Pseudomonadota bacterium]